MNEKQKRQQLRKYKSFATGIFILMALVFIGMTILEKETTAHWSVGYIRAFSEAAMVGALADWFAVTALFHRPLGLPIPHTNLIENSKARIGDNLGNFVVSNFLAPESIRPYIKKIKISQLAGQWLEKPKNQEKLIGETSHILLNILEKLDDPSVVKFISEKAKEMTYDLKINNIIGNGLEYLLNKNDHQKIITEISKQIKDYVSSNEDLVRERVKKESYTFIPSFVDDKIAEKITLGITQFFEELETDQHHTIRGEITQKIVLFSQDLKDNPKWEKEFTDIKNNFLREEKMTQYAQDVWVSIKKSLVNELSQEHSALKHYIQNNLSELSSNLQNNEGFQQKIDRWAQVTAYQYILKNRDEAGHLISATVGNWEGRELSQKLELEVGKDLQFIRINGTLVGGLVGLIIYTLSHFFI